MRPGCLIGLTPRENRAVGRRQVVSKATDIDKAILHQISRSIPQITLYVRVRVVLPHSQRIRELYGRSDIVGRLPLEVVLYGVIDISRPERLDGCIRRVCPGEGTGYGRPPTVCHARRSERSRKGDWLAMRVKMAVVETNREVVIAGANVSRIPLGAISIFGAVKIESLPGRLRIQAHFKLFRHSRGNVYYSPHGIAGISCGKGTVHDIDAFDFSGRYGIPAGRTGICVVIAEQRRQ